MPVIQFPNGLSIRTYEPPPDNFDPLTASDKLLLHHGFPTRPDPQTSPKLRKQWERVFSRKMTYIVPTFRRVEGKTHGPRVKDTTEGTGTSSNWSGSVVFVPNAGDSFKWVEGQWTVPNPYPPTSDGTWYYASQWVGIDGDGSNDVFQAGTETEVESAGGTVQRNCYAWWEWYPDFEVAITNVPVSPGDVIYCLLCVNSTTSGSVYLTNQSNSVSTSFTITAPAGTSLVGNCAEWIVERPSVGGSISSLADYDVVYFDEGIAGYSTGTSGSSSIDLGAGTFLTMTGNGNASLSVPTDETATLMKMTWEKAN